MGNAIIGGNNSKDLLALLQKKRLRFTYMEGTYTNEHGNSEVNVYATIYDIDKEFALDIAKKLNQEFIIWLEDGCHYITADGKQYDEEYLKSKCSGKKVSFKLESIKPDTTSSIRALGGYREIKELIGEWTNE